MIGLGLGLGLGLEAAQLASPRAQRSMPAHEPTKLQRVRFSREHRRRSRARAAAVDARALAELCRP